MVGLAGTSYAGKQYDITYKVNGYLPDGDSERRVFKKLNIKDIGYLVFLRYIFRKDVLM